MLNAFVRGLLVGLLPLAGSVVVVAGSPPDAAARLPTIRRQPMSQGAYAGDTVTLSVDAVPSSLDGSAVLTYQWLAGTNRTPIAAGAYNSTSATLPQLVLTNVATAYSGLFRVAVSSGTNTVVSEPATVSVVVGVASRLRLATVSVSTNVASGLERQFSFPVIFSVMGPDRGSEQHGPSTPRWFGIWSSSPVPMRRPTPRFVPRWRVADSLLRTP